MKRILVALLVGSSLFAYAPAHALGPLGHGPEIDALENRIAELTREEEEAVRNNDFERAHFLNFQSSELILKKMGLHLEVAKAANNSLGEVGLAGLMSVAGVGFSTVGLTRIATALMGLGYIAAADAIVNLVTDGKVSASQWILDHTIVPGTARAATMSDYYRSKEGFGEFARLTPDQAAPFMAKDPELHKMVVETTKFMNALIQQQ